MALVVEGTMNLRYKRGASVHTARGCGFVFGSLALVSLVAATVFAALGAWLILLFART